MHTPSNISRRQLLSSCACGFGSIALSGMLTGQAFGLTDPSQIAAGSHPTLLPKKPHHKPRAKRVIFIWMQGGYPVIEQSLFNLKDDIGETTNVADQHPGVVEQLLKVVEQARSELGDRLTKRQGSEVRPNSGPAKP